MEKIIINGGRPLYGTIEVSGMKNSSLPILFATILVKGTCVIENLPPIDDVYTTLAILKSMGAVVRTIDKTTVEINTDDINCGTAPVEMSRHMRGSYYIAGAELGRFGKTAVPLPGGCDFGQRPIDLHVKGFEALGAKVDLAGGYIKANTEDVLKGASVYMDVVSVGATINVILAAVLAEGVTVIDNAAKEPHVVDLANFLNACGAKVEGAGTDIIRIKGVPSLKAVTYAVLPDMIEAGTYMIAAAATGGKLTVSNVIPKHLESVTAKLCEMGARVEEHDSSVDVWVDGPLRGVNVKTQPYPGFPTDMNPQMCVMMCLAKGDSQLREGVWDNRFRYIKELVRMGADITVEPKIAFVKGKGYLTSAEVKAVDLRAGAAMVIAGLAAEGTTEISDIYHIERGYANLVEKLCAVGADIKKVVVPDGAASAAV